MKFEKLENKLRRIAVDIEELRNFDFCGVKNSNKNYINKMQCRCICDDLRRVADQINHLKKHPYAAGFISYDETTGTYNIDGYPVRNFDTIDYVINYVETDDEDEEESNAELLKIDSDVLDGVDTNRLEYESPEDYFYRITKDLCCDIVSSDVMPVEIIDEDRNVVKDALYIFNTIDEPIDGAFAIMRV